MLVQMKDKIQMSKDKKQLMWAVITKRFRLLLYDQHHFIQHFHYITTTPKLTNNCVIFVFLLFVCFVFWQTSCEETEFCKYFYNIKNPRNVLVVKKVKS